MHIQLSDNMYSCVAGQVLNGFIHVNLVQPMFPSTGLVLTLKGNERSFFRKTHSSGTGENRRTETRTHVGFYPIIDGTFPVYPNQTLPPGQYSFPFCISLPSWLPASMAVAQYREWARLSVEYRLVAQFIPTEKMNWADDSCNISSFHAIVPLYITRPQLQNAVALVDKAEKFDEMIGVCCCKTPCTASVFF